jgi:hypothetical protein
MAMIDKRILGFLKGIQILCLSLHPTPPSSNSDLDVGFVGRPRETPRHQLPAPRLQTSHQRASPEATDEDPEVPPDRSRSTRDLPDGRWQRADSDGAQLEVTPV